MLASPVTACLAEVEVFFRQWIVPQAAQLDQDPTALRQAFQAMGDRNLLALRVPAQWGGWGLDPLAFRQFQECISRYSGALAFLQTQHQSAAALLAQSPNAELQRQYLPGMASGALGMGVGFSHLRRSGQPAVNAIPTQTGFELNGEVPWVTGYECFQHFIVGATCANGAAVLGVVPLRSSTQAKGGRLQVSEPMPLAAMASTQTVQVTLQNWQLSAEAIVGNKPQQWLQTRDRQDALQHGFFALGCAQAGLDIVAAQTARLSRNSQRAVHRLQQSLNTCRQNFYEAQRNSAPYSQSLKLRAEAIDLAHRCTHAAVTASRGAANQLGHPAQRVYREALAFTVFGQTPDILEATLQRLAFS